MTGADALVAGLREAGVETVFGLPGVHNLAVWEALREASLRLVGVRHEQTAAYAADGFARVAGRPGVALVTTGPGAANTLGAVGEAWASGSALVVVATDVPSGARRPGVVRGSLHEAADQQALFSTVTKATLRAEPGTAGSDLMRALGAAAAVPPGPVLLEVPTDLLDAPARPPAPSGRAEDHGEPGDLEEAAAVIDAARRPVIWAGRGALDAPAEVAALAERLGAPVLTTYGARGLLGHHPLAVGLPPHVPEAGRLWDEAGVVVAVGSDLDAMNTQGWRQPQPPALVALNADRRDATKNYDAIVVEARAGPACAALARRLGAREPWADLDAVRDEAWRNLRTRFPDECRFLAQFAAAIPDEAVVVADMCIPGYWLAGFHTPPAPRRLLYPMGWGTLGFAFPASLGAACAHHGPTVCVCGDGGLLFACGDLATLVQEDLDVTVVVFDDGGYGMLRFDQQRKGLAAFGVDLHTPDFVALAASFGLEAHEAPHAGFGQALRDHVATPGPSVLVVREPGLRPPPTTSPRWYRAA